MPTPRPLMPPTSGNCFLVWQYQSEDKTSARLFKHVQSKVTWRDYATCNLTLIAIQSGVWWPEHRAAGRMDLCRLWVSCPIAEQTVPKGESKKIDDCRSKPCWGDTWCLFKIHTWRLFFPPLSWLYVILWPCGCLEFPSGARKYLCVCF